LTRRANRLYIVIMETSVDPPARRHPPRVFSFRYLESDAGRARGLALVDTRSLSADQRAAVRTSTGRARANAPASRRGLLPAAAAPERDRVRARNDRALNAICRAFAFSRREPMTAYLISLALVGLVTIVVAEGMSKWRS
jgi:hypothetical protein